ncbi:MAG: serine/threonine-protein phosphatase [Spirochaetales bacterium]|nr:serine/threonine-protein phosphatase [Spirochaetales bacterium]
MNLYPFFFPELKGQNIARYQIGLKHEIKDFLPSGSLLAIVAWLPFYWIDAYMIPERAVELAILRSGLPLSGILLYFLSRTRSVNDYGSLYGASVLLLLQLLTATITLMTGNNPSYLGGYYIAILITALFPLPFLWVAGILAFSLACYFTGQLILPATHPLNAYDVINLAIATTTGTVFSFFNEKLRLRAWLREQDLETTQSELALRMNIVDNDLSLARAVQQNLLPSVFPKNRQIVFDGLYRSMEKVGGDFYDIVCIAEDNSIVEAGTERNINSFLLIIADAAGHGVSAALMSTMARMAFHHALENQLRSPAEIMNFINKQTCRYLLAEHYLTGIVALISKDQVSYAMAAHRPALLLRAKDQSIEQLESEDLMIGMFSDQNYREMTVKLDPGDHLLFYTDGIIELRSPRGEEFSADRLCALFRSYPGDDFLKQLERDALRFAASRPIDDDITLLRIRIADDSLPGA